jgi:hypothetical protein
VRATSGGFASRDLEFLREKKPIHDRPLDSLPRVNWRFFDLGQGAGRVSEIGDMTSGNSIGAVASLRVTSFTGYADVVDDKTNAGMGGTGGGGVAIVGDGGGERYGIASDNERELLRLLMVERVGEGMLSRMGGTLDDIFSADLCGKLERVMGLGANGIRSETMRLELLGALRISPIERLFSNIGGRAWRPGGNLRGAGSVRRFRTGRGWGRYSGDGTLGGGVSERRL